MDKEANAADVFDRQRWGLPKEAVAVFLSSEKGTI